MFIKNIFPALFWSQRKRRTNSIILLSGINLNFKKDAREYFKNKLDKETETHFLDRFEGSTDKRELFKDTLANYKTLADLIGGGSTLGHQEQLQVYKFTIIL